VCRSPERFKEKKKDEKRKTNRAWGSEAVGDHTVQKVQLLRDELSGANLAKCIQLPHNGGVKRRCGLALGRFGS
jgi:hypothetical protein